jgi:MarR family transcriptional regulator, organic hydroperoxide resistance regulator
MTPDVRALLDAYPKIYFACHTRHVRDLRSRRLLSAHQASILDHIDDTHPISLNQLAAHMGVTASTMSLAIGRLVRMGYVARRRDARDRRVARLLLTPAGLRIREAKSVLEPERVRRMLALLDRRDRAEALRGLALLARAAQNFMQELSRSRRKDVV